MADLITPLGDGAHGAVGPDGPGVTITERAGLHILHIAGDLGDHAFPTAARHALGLPLPQTAGETRDGHGVRVLWQAPDRWLVVSDRPLDVAGVAGLAAVNDIGAGRMVLRLSGRNTRQLLMAGCPLDLHPQAFKAGRCAATRLGPLNVVLDAVGPDIFDLYVTRSYAAFARTWLVRAGLEFGVRLTNL